MKLDRRPVKLHDLKQSVATQKQASAASLAAKKRAALEAAERAALDRECDDIAAQFDPNAYRRRYDVT